MNDNNKLGSKIKSIQKDSISIAKLRQQEIYLTTMKIASERLLCMQAFGIDPFENLGMNYLNSIMLAPYIIQSAYANVVCRRVENNQNPTTEATQNNF